MALSDEDVQAIRSQHVEHTYKGERFCTRELVPWPCPTIRLLDERDALQQQVTDQAQALAVLVELLGDVRSTISMHTEEFLRCQGCNTREDEPHTNDCLWIRIDQALDNLPAVVQQRMAEREALRTALEVVEWGGPLDYVRICSYCRRKMGTEHTAECKVGQALAQATAQTVQEG